MKKLFMVIIILLFAMNLWATGVWIDKEAFETYKAMRTQSRTAELNGDMVGAANLYLQCAAIAEKFGSLKITAYHYNNAGYCLIKYFIQTKNFDRLYEAQQYLRTANLLDKNNPVILKNLAFCHEWLYAERSIK